MDTHTQTTHTTRHTDRNNTTLYELVRNNKYDLIVTEDLIK